MVALRQKENKSAQNEKKTQRDGMFYVENLKGKTHGGQETPRNESLYIERGIYGDLEATTSSSSSSNKWWQSYDPHSLSLSLSY